MHNHQRAGDRLLVKFHVYFVLQCKLPHLGIASVDLLAEAICGPDPIPFSAAGEKKSPKVQIIKLLGM
jgi:hypothetical protein